MQICRSQIWILNFCFPLCECFNGMNMPFTLKSEKAMKMLSFVELNKICHAFFFV